MMMMLLLRLLLVVAAAALVTLCGEQDNNFQSHRGEPQN